MTRKQSKQSLLNRSSINGSVVETQSDWNKISKKLALIVLFDDRLEDAIRATLATLGFRCNFQILTNDDDSSAIAGVLLVYSVLNKDIAGIDTTTEVWTVCQPIAKMFYGTRKSFVIPRNSEELVRELEILGLLEKALELV